MTLQTRWRSVTVGYPCVFGAAGLAGASAFSLCSSPRPRDVGFLRRGTHYSKLPAAPGWPQGTGAHTAPQASSPTLLPSPQPPAPSQVPCVPGSTARPGAAVPAAAPEPLRAGGSPGSNKCFSPFLTGFQVEVGCSASEKKMVSPNSFCT